MGIGTSYSVDVTIKGTSTPTNYTSSFKIDFGTEFTITLYQTDKNWFGSTTSQPTATVKIGNNELAIENNYYIAGKLSNGTYSDSDITIAKA